MKESLEQAIAELTTETLGNVEKYKIREWIGGHFEQHTIWKKGSEYLYYNIHQNNQKDNEYSFSKFFQPL